MNNYSMCLPCPKNKQKKMVGLWKWKKEKEVLGEHELYLHRVDPGGGLFYTVHSKCNICGCTWDKMGLNDYDLYTFFEDLPHTESWTSIYYDDFKNLLKPQYKKKEDQ